MCLFVLADQRVSPPPSGQRSSSVLLPARTHCGPPAAGAFWSTRRKIGEPLTTPSCVSPTSWATSRATWSLSHQWASVSRCGQCVCLKGLVNQQVILIRQHHTRSEYWSEYVYICLCKAVLRYIAIIFQSNWNLRSKLFDSRLKIDDHTFQVLHHMCTWDPAKIIKLLKMFKF